MPLTLVLGPANSAKAGEVLGAYEAVAGRGALLVVPTAVDADHYARELAGRGAVLGSVLTFAGLAVEVARRAGYSARRLSALQRERVLRGVLRDARLAVLGRSAASSGFLVATGELIVELQRSLVTPQRFAQALRAWAAGEQRRGPYAEDVLSLYLAYVRELDRRGRVDSELYAWRALDALRAKPGRWGDTPVFLYGFDDLHSLERDAVETLSRLAGAHVTVSLTYESGRAAPGARAEAVEELRGLAERVIELPAVDQHYEPASRVALHRLERGLFELTAERFEPGPAVGLLEAGGERAEAELVAASVVALVRAGMPGEQIVVVYRSLARLAPLLERVFAAYGIAVASEATVPFVHTALGCGVRALARCALLEGEEGESGADDLLAYLRSPGRLDRREIADVLELEVRREGLRSAADARARLGWKLGEIDRLRAAVDPVAELCCQARALLAAGHRGAAGTLQPLEELDARALGVLLGAVEELEELGERVSGVELIELLDGLRVRAGAAVRPGAVLLAEPLSIRARRFRAVFVCGLQEGVFPRPGLPEPFLSDERRREIALASGLRLRSREDALARERHLFYACVSRATERVVLSYRSSDEEGNLALPSPFIGEVAELLSEDWTARRRSRLLTDVVWTPEGAPTAREFARARAAAPELSAAAGEQPEHLKLGEVALRHVRHMEVLSAGALEAYGDCPVKWLLERELRPVRLEPEPDPLARGNYMHEALEQVLLGLGRALSTESLPDAKRILADVLEGMPAALASGRGEAVRAAALRAIEADLTRYLEHEAASGCGWEPRGLELRFGFEDGEGSLAPLALGEDGERVLLRGVIDRVDVDPAGALDSDRAGGAIVRDYKSGRVRPEQQGARWRSEHRLQVALYMLAVRRLLGLEPVAGFYQPLGGPDLRARGVFLKGAPVGDRVLATDARQPADLDEVLDGAEADAVAIAARLRSGELTPCPQTCSRDGCRYPGICRVG
ncbi:MAG: PD-(D/E)XK nuclease family protein [Solirubrobacteraceae bacterium]